MPLIRKENVSHKERNVESEIKKDIKELETIKDLEIAEEVVIFIFGDYYLLL